MSVSGNRYSLALNNLNSSSQEVSVDLINPDELMKMPYEDCIILGHNMPPYMGKKNVFYADDRFSWKVFNENVDTGKVETGFAAPYKQEEINLETAGLPSQIRLKKEKNEEALEAPLEEIIESGEGEKETFSPIDFLENYTPDGDDGIVEEWDSPMSFIQLDEGEPPPHVAGFEVDDFDSEGDVIYTHGGNNAND